MAKKVNTETEQKVINIPAMNIQTMNLRLVGDSPLICHAWSEKAKKMMLDKQMKKATAGREVRDPFKEFVESLYWLSEKPENLTMEDVVNAKFGFPTVAFKAAAIDAAYQSGIVDKKTTLRGAFHILGEFAEIEGLPSMREDMVRIGMGTADLRYRAEFKEWATTLHIQFNANVISVEQICNFFNVGGFACGIGEWRPAKDGTYGRYHVE